jgi:hypothetical protein
MVDGYTAVIYCRTYVEAGSDLFCSSVLFRRLFSSREHHLSSSTLVCAVRSDEHTYTYSAEASVKTLN